jgi:hypothetical protein
MPFILGANTLSTGAYEVANSCRFNDGDSAYMHKTPSSDGNRRTFTFSFWVKRGELTSHNPIAEVYSSGENVSQFYFNAGDQFTWYESQTSNKINLTTNAKQRDPSAWYHIVVKVDTTQSTNTDRVKIYINNELQTITSGSNTYPDQNFQSYMNSTHDAIEIGRTQYNSNQFDGYLAEVCMIDGSALAPSSFGEADEDSPTIWKPIDVSGLTFGTNGFYLDFEDSSNLGNDANGGTDFTEVNLAATDQTTDTCTNNFATLNPLVNFNSGVFSEGNCAITFGDDTISTIGVTRGRWYWEAQRTNTSNEAHFGIGVSKGFSSATSIVSSGDRVYVRGGATFVSAVSNLSILTFGSNGGTPASVGNGDVIGFYLDLESDTKNITIKKNDGATPVIDIDLTYSGAEPVFAFCRMNSGCSSSWNFGNPIAALTSANSDPNGYGSFEFSTTLSGVDYYALCTKNLAEYG